MNFEDFIRSIFGGDAPRFGIPERGFGDPVGNIGYPERDFGRPRFRIPERDWGMQRPPVGGIGTNPPLLRPPGLVNNPIRMDPPGMTRSPRWGSGPGVGPISGPGFGMVQPGQQRNSGNRPQMPRKDGPYY